MLACLPESSREGTEFCRIRWHPYSPYTDVRNTTKSEANVRPPETGFRPHPLIPQRDRLAVRVHSTTIQELQSKELIEDTLLLKTLFVKALFDTGALTHS